MRIAPPIFKNKILRSTLSEYSCKLIRSQCGVCFAPLNNLLHSSAQTTRAKERITGRAVFLPLGDSQVFCYWQALISSLANNHFLYLYRIRSLRLGDKNAPTQLSRNSNSVRAASSKHIPRPYFPCSAPGQVCSPLVICAKPVVCIVINVSRAVMSSREKGCRRLRFLCRPTQVRGCTLSPNMSQLHSSAFCPRFTPLPNPRGEWTEEIPKVNEAQIKM